MIIFSIIFAALITYIKHRSSASTDTIIGVFSSAGIAIGLILMSHGGNFSSYTSYFIGDILSITTNELVYLFITVIVVVIAWCFLFNKILIISINDGFAASRGIKTLYIEMIFCGYCSCSCFYKYSMGRIVDYKFIVDFASGSG